MVEKIHPVARTLRCASVTRPLRQRRPSECLLLLHGPASQGREGGERGSGSRISQEVQKDLGGARL
eukprot:2771618-Prorocentrum_lima.AAC.1